MRRATADDLRLALVGIVAGLCFVLVADRAAAVVRPSIGGAPVVVAGATLDRDPASPAVARLEAATVLVRSLACGSLDGTGVILRSGLVLTNAHVLAGARAFTVETADGEIHESGNATRPSDGDLAAGIAPEGSESIGLELAERDPGRGDRVALAGHPAGGSLTIRTAAVTGAIVGKGPLDPPTILRLDVVAVPGDSGSPVIDDRGRLVGMVYAAEHGSRTALVIPASEIRRALLTMEPATQEC